MFEGSSNLSADIAGSLMKHDCKNITGTYKCLSLFAKSLQKSLGIVYCLQ